MLTKQTLAIALALALAAATNAFAAPKHKTDRAQTETQSAYDHRSSPLSSEDPMMIDRAKGSAW